MDVAMREPELPAGELEPDPRCLPTLQRNALCKLFERADFSPAEVVAVGYLRLQKVNGIGPKGLEIICHWARAHGLELQPVDAVRSGRLLQRVERAIRLLERHGYEVHRPRSVNTASLSGSM